jgi:hypothetical protein
LFLTSVLACVTAFVWPDGRFVLRAEGDYGLPSTALRIPSKGGSPLLECAMEWAVDLGGVAVDARGLPKPSQRCVDNDPSCDHDPTPGNCTFWVWACAGGADSRLACPAHAVLATTVLAPKISAPGFKGVAGLTLAQALLSADPANGSGEVCSSVVAIDVPLKKNVAFKTISSLAAGGADKDALTLSCKPN